jgi:hypothetical protein
LMVFFLFILAIWTASCMSLSKMSSQKLVMIVTALVVIPQSGWICFKTSVRLAFEFEMQVRIKGNTEERELRVRDDWASVKRGQRVHKGIG